MRGRLRQWIGFFIMVIGLAFLSGPFLLGAYGDAKQKKVVYQMHSELEEYQVEHPVEAQENNQPIQQEGTQSEQQEKQQEETQGEQQEQLEDVPTPSIIDSSEKHDNDRLYQDAYAYNQSLLTPGTQEMEGLTEVEEFAFSTTNYGFSENVIGVVKVPRLGIELSLYLGADYDNMAKGLAVFGKTSLPLGNPDENVSIAGHRGWRGTEVFRNIQLLQENDPIYITTPWKILCYRVSEIRIVTPDDNSWCKVEKGRTMITLMTCHPYGNNYQRYIVFADYAGEGMPSEEDIEKENASTYKNEVRKVIEVKPNGTTEIVEVSPEKVEADGSEYGAVYSNAVILAEDRMKPVAIVLAFFVLLAGIWLTVVTIKDAKHPDNEE